MPIHKYIETALSLYLNLFDVCDCDVYQAFSLYLLLQHTC